MPDPNDMPSQALNQYVEKQVRVLIGELNVQLILLRGMLEMAQQPQHPPPKPAVPPQPVPDTPGDNPKPQPSPPGSPHPPRHPTDPAVPDERAPQSRPLNGGGHA